MSRGAKAKRRSDPFKQFRLEVSGEILRNLQNTLYSNADIPDQYYVTELLDEYAIRLLVEWLATKFGFDRYAPDMKPVENSQHFSVLDLLEERHHYPFLNTDAGTVSCASRQRLFQLLDQSFTPQTELIGVLYEHIVNRPLISDGDGAFDLAPDIQLLDKRRIVGQFYTPPHIVRHCFDQVIEADSNNFMSKLQESPETAFNAGSSTVAEAREQRFRMLDPACGTGNFLVGAVKLVCEQICDRSLVLQFICGSLYGIELDGKALAMARCCILLEVLSRKPDLYRQKYCRDMFDALTHNLTISDSVLCAAAESISPMHRVDSFDLVITNPPYVSYGSRNQPDLLPSQAMLLRKIYPEGAEYKIRLHSIFQDIALRFCRDGGHAVLLVPDGFLTGSFYGRLRRLLLEKSSVVSLSELPEGTIPGAVVGRWCVAQYRKSAGERPPTWDYSVRLRSSCDLEIKLHSAKIATIVSPNKLKMRMLFSQEDEHIFEHLSSMRPLNQVLRGHTGLRSTTGQKNIVSQRREGAQWQKGIKSGSQVSPYCVAWDGTWLRVDPDWLFKGGFDQQIIGNEKILLRQTGDRLIAALDAGGLYHLNNVHSFSSEKLSRATPAAAKIDLHFAVALMNSNLWLYLYQMNTRERSRALAQIDIETVEAMPVPARSFADCERGQLIASFAKRCSAMPESKKRTIWQRAIDRLVYDLYGLSDRLVDHVENYCRQVNARRSSVHIALPASSEIDCFV